VGAFVGLEAQGLRTGWRGQKNGRSVVVDFIHLRTFLKHFAANVVRQAL
jgi:hypothetical protein